MDGDCILLGLKFLTGEKIQTFLGFLRLMSDWRIEPWKEGKSVLQIGCMTEWQWSLPVEGKLYLYVRCDGKSCLGFIRPLSEQHPSGRSLLVGFLLDRNLYRLSQAARSCRPCPPKPCSMGSRSKRLRSPGHNRTRRRFKGSGPLFTHYNRRRLREVEDYVKLCPVGK